jgi:predicted nucleotidyltransferase
LILCFGSALTDFFDDFSDIDLLVVYKSKDQIRNAYKSLYSAQPFRDRSVDFVCVDQETYRYKSQIGGICFTAATEGRLVFDKEVND